MTKAGVVVQSTGVPGILLDYVPGPDGKRGKCFPKAVNAFAKLTISLCQVAMIRYTER